LLHRRFIFNPEALIPPFQADRTVEGRGKKWSL
jgi:hypothetical protein